jgi:hypothetical protein
MLNTSVGAVTGKRGSGIGGSCGSYLRPVDELFSVCLTRVPVTHFLGKYDEREKKKAREASQSHEVNDVSSQRPNTQREKRRGRKITH